MSKLCRIMSCYKKRAFFVLRVVTLFLELLSRLFIVCSLSDLLQQQLELFFWCSLWAFLLALQLTLFFFAPEAHKHFHCFLAPILPLFESPSRASTPSFSFPSSLSSPLFSWSLHSTPPLQTGHKRAESATPDLQQTFQSSRPFQTARVHYPFRSISQSCLVFNVTALRYN